MTLGGQRSVAFPAKLLICNHKHSIAGIPFGETHRTAPRYQWGSTGDPAFLQPPEFRSILITHHLPSPNHQKQTRSQYFNNSTNTLNTINVSNTFTVEDGRSNIISWLSPLDPKLQHQDIRDCLVENVGEWPPQIQEFRGLSYLNSKQVKALSASLGSYRQDSNLQSTPFLEYSSLYFQIGRNCWRLS